MRVFCISDSLGLPRPGVSYEDTWYYMLQKECPSIEFYPYFIRKTTTDSLKTIYYDYADYFNPNLVIVQLGICDCAPRIVNTNKLFWRLYFKIFDGLRAKDLAWKLVKRFLKRNNPSRVYVPIERFISNNEFFLKECINRQIKVLYVLIANPALSLQEKSPAMFKNIQRYNEALSELAIKYSNYVSFINPLSAGDIKDYTEDGYHTNKEGANKVARGIIDYLDKKV